MQLNFASIATVCRIVGYGTRNAKISQRSAAARAGRVDATPRLGAGRESAREGNCFNELLASTLSQVVWSTLFVTT